MFKLKLINKPKMMKLKCNFTFPNIVLANLQEKETTPTKEKQQIIADQQYDGLSKVVVNAIPDEYIIPNGDINIIENGTYDVTDKTNAIVNIPEKKLGSKIITENGIYKASDDNLDGYSEVEVATSGVDINDYYVTDTALSSIKMYIKKIPYIILSSGANFFSGYANLIEIEELNTENINGGCIFTFENCTNLQKLPDNIDTSNVTSIQGMFARCRSLIKIPNMNTSNVTSMRSAFTTCTALKEIPKLNAEKVINVVSILQSCTELIDFGGLENYGQAFETTKSENYYDYTLDLSTCTKLTHDSLMNVINNLYDIKTKGCNPQSLVLGSTNLSKLSSEEVAIATNKGFNVN